MGGILQVRKNVRLGVLAGLLLTVMLSACTLPRFQSQHEMRYEPAIVGAAFVAGDGADLPMRQWLPAKKQPRAVILALHGFNDYSNAFASPGEYFARRGIAVFAYDQRGFGNTSQRGVWGGRDNLTRDLAEAVLAISHKYPKVPLYVLGESMGGAVTIAALSKPGFPLERVKGVILSSPALWGDGTFNPLYRFMLWVTAHTLPQMELTGKGLRIRASDNIEMLRALGRDPLVIKKTRVDAIYGLVQLMDEAHLCIPQLHKPLLFLYGKNDQVIPPVAIQVALQQMSQPYRFAYYDKGWHMLLRDLQAETVWQDIMSWIENPDAPLPSGAEAKPETFIKKYEKKYHPIRKKWPQPPVYGK